MTFHKSHGVVLNKRVCVLQCNSWESQYNQVKGNVSRVNMKDYFICNIPPLFSSSLQRINTLRRFSSNSERGRWRLPWVTLMTHRHNAMKVNVWLLFCCGLVCGGPIKPKFPGRSHSNPVKSMFCVFSSKALHKCPQITTYNPPEPSRAHLSINLCFS